MLAAALAMERQKAVLDVLESRNKVSIGPFLCIVIKTPCSTAVAFFCLFLRDCLH